MEILLFVEEIAGESESDGVSRSLKSKRVLYFLIS